jgi:hypothetical protein
MPLTYKTCPKCGHERAPEETASEESCPSCGLIFAKYFQTRLGRAPARTTHEQLDDDDGSTPLGERVKELLFYVPDQVEPLHVYVRAALLIVLVLYGVRLVAMDVPSWEMASSLMHLPMVPIHEFGHILFRPFGEFMTMLGGSLFQAGLPLVFAGIFLVKNRDPFAAAVMLWWSAVAVMDIAPYVYDAGQPQHVLLTGRTGDTGSHDFIDVLADLGLLAKAQPVGYAVHRFGAAMLGAAIGWAGWIVWRQWQVRESESLR